MGSSLHCLECEAAVHGDGLHQERGFCSEGCMEDWNEWMIHERSLAIPGLGDLLLDGEYPTLEQVLLYITVVLGCLVRIAVTENPSMFLMNAVFEWSCSGHSLFVGGSAAAFRGIDGFALDEEEIYLDDEENIGLRRIELRKIGKDLTRVCLDLTMEVLSTKRRFDRECDKWAKSHTAELWKASVRYMASTKLRTLNGEPIAHAHGEFIRWLDSLGGGEKRWA